MAAPHIRVNWTIPAPIIITLIGQAAVLAWLGATWKGSVESTIALLEGRIAVIEQSVASNAQVNERVTRVEEKVGGLKEQSTRIEQKLDTIIERRK